MKRFKKMMAIVIVAVMTMMYVVPMTALAADPIYSITVTNNNETVSISGKTYSAYKLFDMTYNTDKTAYAYSIDSDGDGAWAWDTIKGTLNSTTGVYTNSTYGLTFTPSAADPTVYSVTSTMTDEQTRDLADALESHKGTANGSATVASGAQTCTINTDPNAPGYYLVYGTVASADPNSTDSDIVAAVALTSTDPTATVNPKASIPTLNKKITKVQEGSTEVSGAVLDAAGQAAVAKVGSTVSYEITATTPDLTGYDDYTYIIGDSLSNGLNYVANSFSLKIKNTTAAFVTETTTTKSDNELIVAADGKSFTLTIPYDVLKAAGTGEDIVLTYSCTIDDDALTTDYENNTASLEYSRSPYENVTNHTPDKKTYVIDLNIDVDKVAGSASGSKLDGAQFKLYKLDTDGTTKLYYKKGTDAITWESTQAAGDTFTTDTEGKLTTQIVGLDKGDYYLEETVPPKGYNVLDEPVKVTITASESSNTVTYSATTDGESIAVTNGTVDLTQAQNANQPVATATIVNNAGQKLPETGGIGTTMFYLIGAILVIGAGVILVTRRRVDGQQ